MLLSLLVNVILSLKQKRTLFSLTKLVTYHAYMTQQANKIASPQHFFSVDTCIVSNVTY